MKFIIDGDGEISEQAAKDLLRDLVSPYPHGTQVIFTTGTSTAPVTRSVISALNELHRLGYATYNQVPELMPELNLPGDKTYIVVGAGTRPHYVNHCLDNDIQVLDLTKGLYPVTDRIT